MGRNFPDQYPWLLPQVDIPGDVPESSNRTGMDVTCSGLHKIVTNIVRLEEKIDLKMGKGKLSVDKIIVYLKVQEKL